MILTVFDIVYPQESGVGAEVSRHDDLARFGQVIPKLRGFLDAMFTSKMVGDGTDMDKARNGPDQSNGPLVQTSPRF